MSEVTDDVEILEPEIRIHGLTKDGKYTIQSHGRFKFVNRTQEERFKCIDGCCNVVVDTFKWIDKLNYPAESFRTHNRAGVFPYDSTTGKILLVQSCGLLWGPPKGGVYENESIAEGARRELYEETGINIDIEVFNSSTPSRVRTNTYLYFMDVGECPIKTEKNTDGASYNDVSGHMWVSLSCLVDMCKVGTVKLTKQCKMMIGRFVNQNMTMTAVH